MYYKIKIKSNGSEFSLESTNKEITQREMDLYFADIFNASYDFKSKIKKIEVVNKDVKSINDFENQAPKAKEQFYRKPVEEAKPKETMEHSSSLEVREAVELQSETPQIKIMLHEVHQPYTPSAVKFENSSIETTALKTEEEPAQAPKVETPVQEYFYEIEPVKTQEPETLSQNYSYEPNPTQAPKPEVSAQEILYGETLKHESLLQESTHNEAPKPQVSIEELVYGKALNQESHTQEPIYNEAPEVQNEIDELISLAQKKINLADTNSKVEHILFQDGKNDNTQTFGQMRAEASGNISYSSHEEEKKTYAANNQAKLDDIFNTPRTEQMIPTPQMELVPDNNMPQVSLNDIELSLESNAQETITIRDNSSANSLDFKTFLAEAQSKNTYDDFVVCAYFIKNVLRNPDFTMKLINSKLFQATGKIADMSVVDELTAKGYIKVIQTDMPRTYSITTDGEMYFINLQQ